MKRVCWLLIGLTALTVGQPASLGTQASASLDDFQQLVLSPGVADNIALLFGKFDTELVLCLEGERRGTDLYVTDFRMPHILTSETGRVKAASCKPSRRTVGTWHNHPATGFNLVSASPEALARNCYLSRTDIRDFQRRRNALVSVVSCAPRTYAYWTRGDVESLSSDRALLMPPPGQLVQAELRENPHTSGLTQAREH